MNNRIPLITKAVLASSALIIGAKVIGESRPDNLDCLNNNLKITQHSIMKGFGANEIVINSGSVRIYSDYVTTVLGYNRWYIGIKYDHPMLNTFEDYISQAISKLKESSPEYLNKEFQFDISNARAFCTTYINNNGNNERLQGLSITVLYGGNQLLDIELVGTDDYLYVDLVRIPPNTRMPSITLDATVDHRKFNEYISILLSKEP